MPFNINIFQVLTIDFHSIRNNTGYDDEEPPLPKQVKQEIPPSKPVRMEQMSPSFM